MWRSHAKCHHLQVVSGRLCSQRQLPNKRASCSWGTQFWWLLKRSFVAQLRNPTDVTSRLLLSCWIGAFAGGPSTSCTAECTLYSKSS